MMKRVLFTIFVLISLQLTVLAKDIPFQSVPNQPYLQSAPIMIDSEEYNTVILRMRSDHGGTGRLFWLTSYDNQFNQQRNIWFSIKPGLKNYYFNIPSQDPNWIGWIKGLLLFPETNSRIEVNSAEIVKGNLFTNIISGWQEFWGPKGRKVIGSTINTMQSPNLFGRSIFVYIYWIAGLLIVCFFARETYLWSQQKKKNSFNNVFINTGKAAFVIVIVFWGLLEASGWYNNWLQLRSDWKYVGKTQEEKLVLANTGDFYPFIQFCEKHIPANAKFDMRVPPLYNDIKARYYLYPRQASTTEAEYLVVYDMAVEPLLADKHVMVKTFRPNAYVMRKRSQ